VPGPGGGTDLGGERLAIAFFEADGAIQNERRQATRGKKRHAAWVILSTEGEPPVTGDPMPSQRCRLVWDPGHGLDGIPDDLGNPSDLSHGAKIPDLTAAHSGVLCVVEYFNIGDATVKTWLKGFRGTIVLILLWIVGWGVGFGGLIEAFIDPNGELVDIWPALMGFTGLVGAVVMSGLVRMGDRRSFDEMSYTRFASLGAVSGLLLGVLASVIGLASDIAIDTATVKPVSPLLLIGITTGLGAVAGFGSSVFFKLVGGGVTAPA
jgi:hypothetical protein